MLDPQYVALFASEEEVQGVQGSGAQGGGSGGGGGGGSSALGSGSGGSGGGGGGGGQLLQRLAVKYVRVTSKVWSPQEIAEELHKVR